MWSTCLPCVPKSSCCLSPAAVGAAVYVRGVTVDFVVRFPGLSGRQDAYNFVRIYLEQHSIQYPYVHWDETTFPLDKMYLSLYNTNKLKIGLYANDKLVVCSGNVYLATDGPFEQVKDARYTFTFSPLNALICSPR